MEAKQVTELLVAEKLAGIALDTSEFEAQGMRLETGLLAQMAQFSGGKVSFLIPDVVMREVHSHLVARTSDAQNEILRALRKGAGLWDLGDELRDSVAKQLFREKGPEAQVEARLQKYAETTGLSNLSADEHVDLKALIGMYFGSRAPFEGKAAKKSEFPDAIALLCLEAWAQKNDAYLLVVSRDSGWVKFCERAERLIPLGDLALALSYFQLRTNAYAVCKAFSQMYETGLPKELATVIRSRLDDSIWEVQFDVEAASNYPYEHEISDISVIDYHFTPAGENEEELAVPIRYDTNQVVAAAELSIRVSVDVHFSFSYRDPIDKDDIPFGSSTVSLERDITVECLLTFEGDFETDPEEFELTAFEVLPTREYLEMGEVGPNWLNEERDHDA